jgi:hypothetical protein
MVAPSSDASATPAAIAPSPSSSADSHVATDEIELTLTAGAPIETVRAPGLRKVEIDGKTARVSVQPFTAPLTVEVTVTGGAIARAVATPAGPRALTMSLAQPTGQPVRAKSKGELQANPYGAE